MAINREAANEIEKLKKDNVELVQVIRYWSFCTRIGMKEYCPEKESELRELMVRLKISPY